MNIILIVIDSLRADHLACYGYPKGTSPNIDIIAKQSLLFENAFAQCNWTYPSLYSVISGRYPSVLQLEWVHQQINKDFITLPEILSNKGYNTAIFSNFEFLICPGTFGSHFQERRHLSLDGKTPSFLRNWISQYHNSFIFFHIGEYTHEPFFVDREYVNEFIDDDFEKKDIASSDIIKALTSKIATESKGNTHKLRKLIGKINRKLIRLTQSELTYILACYDAGILYIDNIIGEIYRMIREENKEYLFILTADHGQAFLEHNIFGHGLGLYDEVVRVPLMVDFSNKHNLKISEPVELIDIFPTVMDILGFETKFELNGWSLFSLLRNIEYPNNRRVISEGHPYISIRSNNYKLITNYYRLLAYHEIYKKLFIKKSKTHSLKRNIQAFLSSDKLYNIEKDRMEKINLRWKEIDIYKGLKTELKDFMEVSIRTSLPPVNVNMEEEIIKKQLSDLGYL